MDNSANFSFIPFIASEEVFFFFFFFFFAGLTFRLPCQSNKVRCLDKNDMLGGGPLNKHYCKTSVKVSAMR